MNHGKTLGRKTLLGSLLLFLILVAALSVQAASLTRASGIEGLNSLKQFYTVPNFKIGGTYEFGKEAAYEWGGSGGVTLESLGSAPLQTAYIAVGTPSEGRSREDHQRRHHQLLLLR